MNSDTGDEIEDILTQFIGYPLQDDTWGGFGIALKKLNQLVMCREKQEIRRELEEMRHLIQEESHDNFCEKCQEPATLGCYTTNRKINRRLSELKGDTNESQYITRE